MRSRPRSPATGIGRGVAHLALACLATVLAPGNGEALAQSSPPAARAVVVLGRDDKPYQDTLQGMREVLGQHLALERVPLADDPLRAAAGSRVAVAIGARAALALQGRARPLVSCMILNNAVIPAAAEQYGVLLEYPLSVQFAWIRRVLPDAKRVGVLYNAEENQARIAAAIPAARAVGLELVSRAVETPADIPDALARLGESVDVLWGLSDRLTLNPATTRQLLLFSHRDRIPLIGPSDAWVAAGALFALGWDFEDIGRQCGELTLQVARGARPQPAYFPPRKVTYSINRRAAERFRVNLPAELIRGAMRIHD